MAVAVVLLIFIVMMAVSAQRDAEASFLEERLEKKRFCQETAFFIATLYSQGSGTEIEITLGKDVNIVGNRVQVNDVSCTFLADANAVQLQAGQVRARNIADVVVLENA